MLVTISFFQWTVTGSLSLVLLATLAIGVLIGLLVLAPNLLKKTFKSSSQRKRIDALENEVSQSPSCKNLRRPSRRPTRRNYRNH